jgi:hypothetical protein
LVLETSVSISRKASISAFRDNPGIGKAVSPTFGKGFDVIEIFTVSDMGKSSFIGLSP